MSKEYITIHDVLSSVCHEKQYGTDCCIESHLDYSRAEEEIRKILKKEAFSDLRRLKRNIRNAKKIINDYRNEKKLWITGVITALNDKGE